MLYTDRPSSGAGNGSNFGGPFDNVTAYDLIFSDAPDFSSILHTESVLGPGYANTDPPVLVNGGLGVTARYVRFDVTATAGANPGGAGIQFLTDNVPEPATLALLGLGMAALLCQRAARSR